MKARPKTVSQATKPPETLVCGVGINDADYAVHHYETVNGKRKLTWVCPYYRAWANMLARCYNAGSVRARPSYKGCEVWAGWRRFSVFKSWMETQDWKGKDLDKDILHPGNKVYSPDTCIFVTHALNKFVTDRSRNSGVHPIGVYLAGGRFRSYCGNPFTGKVEHLGYFNNPEDAHEAWRQRKHELACRYAEEQADERVAKALRERFAPAKPSNEVAT